jgi:uncharacterized protein YbjT (DUF2867 family)
MNNQDGCMSSMKQVLVLGGTGFVGRAVCECLAEALRPPRVCGCQRGALRTATACASCPMWTCSAPTCTTKPLRRLVAGCDAVVNLVAILHGSAAAFEQVHVALPRKLAQACQAAGVRRLVHVSALGVGPGAPSNYLRSKTAGEAVLTGSQAGPDGAAALSDLWC